MPIKPSIVATNSVVISPADIKRTAAAITNVSSASVQIAETLYPRIVMGTTYSSPQFTEIRENYYVKYQVLDDIATVVEAMSLHVQKAYQEDLATSDVLRQEIVKSAAHEVVSLVEQYQMGIAKPFKDSSELTDYITVFLSKAFNEVVLTSDKLVTSMSKPMLDTVTTVDDFVMSVEYLRHFKDFVAIDDFVDVDKYRNVIKHNIASAQDNSMWDFVKNQTELVNVGDLANWVFDKNLNDVLVPADSLAMNIRTQLPQELLSATDSFTFELGRTFSDNFGTTDSVTFLTQLGVMDPALIGDLKKAVIHKVLKDAVTAADVIQLGVTIPRGDGYSISDEFVKLVNKNPQETLSTTDSHTFNIESVLSDPISLPDKVSLNTVLRYADTIAILDNFSYLKGRQEAYSDGTGVMDALQLAFRSQITDTLGLSDNIHFEVGRLFSDVAGVLDNASKQVGKAWTEDTTVADEVLVALQKTVQDYYSTLDTISLVLRKAEQDQVNTNDTYAIQSVLNKSDVGDILSVVDSLALNTDLRLPADTTGVLDQYGIQTQKDLSEFLGTSDDTTFGITKHILDFVTAEDKLMLNTGIPLSDSVGTGDDSAVGFSRAVYDGVGTSDTYDMAVGKGVQDGIAVDDVVNVDQDYSNYKHNVTFTTDQHYKGMEKVVSEVATVQELLKHSLTRPIGDGAGTADDSFLNVGKGVNELIIVPDTMYRDVVKSVSEPLVVQEIVAKDLAKPYSEAVSVSDTFSKGCTTCVHESVASSDEVYWDLGKGLSEVLLAVDSTAVSVHKSLSDTSSTVDFVQLDLGKVFSESVASGDLVSVSVGKTHSETMVTSDSTNWGLGKNLGDSSTVSDTATTSFDKALSDLAALQETIHKQVARTLTDSVESIDTSYLSVSKPFVDSVGASSYNRMSFISKLGESIALADNMTITIVRGGSSMFNASLFNQSTFG